MQRVPVFPHRFELTAKSGDPAPVSSWVFSDLLQVSGDDPRAAVPTSKFEALLQNHTGRELRGARD